MKSKLLYTACLICFLLLQVSCEDDSYVYPPVQLEFVSVQTDEAGRISYFQKDDGMAYSVINADRYKTLTPDTIYRMMCNYEVREGESTIGGYAFTYSLQRVISVNPLNIDRLSGEMKTDPLEVQSIWKKSPDYINMVLLIKMQNEQHTFHFIEEGWVQEAGHKRLILTLYHDSRNDVEAYTQKGYLSVPLIEYKNVLVPGDVIDFRINTYSKGVKTYSFTY